MDSRPHPLPLAPSLLQTLERSVRRPRPGWVAVVFLCAVLIAPLVLVDVPPVLDYPNHLARAYLLAHGADHPELAAFFRPAWSILPNLGTDLVLVPLLRALPDSPTVVHVAGRVVLAAIILLPVLGAIAYSRAVFHRASWWPLASGLVAYNAAILQGFVNFTAGTGLALLAAALWAHYRQSHPARTILIAAIASIVLFFTHLLGLALFLLLTGCLELQTAWEESRSTSQNSFAGALFRRAQAFLPILMAPAALYARSALAGMTPDPVWLTPPEKLAHLLVPVINYNLSLDLLTAAAIVLFLAAAVATGRARIPLATGVALMVLLALYAITPFEFKGTSALDMRFAILAGFLLFAGILPTPSARLGHLAALIFTSLFVARMAVLSFAWFAYNDDLVQLRATIAGVSPGNRVFLTSIGPTAAPQYWAASPAARHLSNGTRTDYHLAALMVIERLAYWPFLFANGSQQPIEIMPRYAALGDQTYDLPDLDFAAICTGRPPTAKLDRALCGYDQVLLLEAGALTDPASCGAGRLTLLKKTDFAALFQVKQSACQATPQGG
jgi:hypothetical protein